MSTFNLGLLALLGLAAAFALLYLWARRIDNYGIVDVAWSLAFAAVAGFYAWQAPGWVGRRALLAGMVGFWSLRLGLHLWVRVAGHHPVEDGRYVRLRQEWAGRLGPMMFGFFELQAASVVLLALPFLLSLRHRVAQLQPVEWAAAVLWLLALAGESLADRQLATFKRDPAKVGRVCDVGLWRYSRHPNYFFEWLVWVAYALFALPAAWGWLSVLSPLLILCLLLRVTGIPLNEAQAVRSKGDAYRRYQAATSAFIPWFPRSLP